ncbi:hypothetical protein CEUSTIGMA_g12056.t1 [Chlamydomonas eustigma]|uniref:Uncharacterized protein n=1 Tax=Chlamydomonas eustigma TaxID=1157962 RepID=A0A250XNG6_9CHLO|nr:hypothetical protein CEUSTIGMA_g12056.t1 [Chlamydomonas eustigma]|eukprot:GAX84635.1 hypothetical protein CEUSTIGMA_g12056.t1 [Chlamydomonas eustigma]
MITIVLLTLTGCTGCLLGRQVSTSQQHQQQVERTFVECGVTITERADASPKIGSCQMNTTGDPRVFGPDAWKTFHRFANSYPESPNKKSSLRIMRSLRGWHALSVRGGSVHDSTLPCQLVSACALQCGAAHQPM